MATNELKHLEINMAKMETKLDSFENKLDNHIVDQKKDISEIKETISGFIREADQKYAPMWVAEGLKWALAIIVGAIILTVLSYIGLKAYFL